MAIGHCTWEAENPPPRGISKPAISGSCYVTIPHGVKLIKVREKESSLGNGTVVPNVTIGWRPRSRLRLDRRRHRPVPWAWAGHDDGPRGVTQCRFSVPYWISVISRWSSFGV